VTRIARIVTPEGRSATYWGVRNPDGTLKRLTQALIHPQATGKATGRASDGASDIDPAFRVIYERNDPDNRPYQIINVATGQFAAFRWDLTLGSIGPGDPRAGAGAVDLWSYANNGQTQSITFLEATKPADDGTYTLSGVNIVNDAFLNNPYYKLDLQGVTMRSVSGVSASRGMGRATLASNLVSSLVNVGSFLPRTKLFVQAFVSDLKAALPVAAGVIGVGAAVDLTAIAVSGTALGVLAPVAVPMAVFFGAAVFTVALANDIAAGAGASEYFPTNGSTQDAGSEDAANTGYQNYTYGDAGVYIPSSDGD